MMVSGVRELFFRFFSNRYLYRIPVYGDRVGDIISIKRCSNWLEIEIEVKDTTLLK
jgi:hypothetical protein